MSTPADRSGRKAAAGADVPPHFVITLGGVSFAYCYIRKNACSAWKRLLIHESPVPFQRSDWKSEIEFMLAHQGLRTIEEIDRCDHRVVVLRDPVDRFVSAFISLLVTRTPPATRRLKRVSEKAFGRDVFDLSFDQLLESQLPRRAPRRGGLDKHFWPQVWHLAPTRYTDVLDIDRLAVDMRRLIGEELGARYFDKAVNTTSTAKTFDDPEAPSLPARDLVERFRDTGRLPARPASSAAVAAKRFGPRTTRIRRFSRLAGLTIRRTRGSAWSFRWRRRRVPKGSARSGNVRPAFHGADEQQKRDRGEFEGASSCRMRRTAHPRCTGTRSPAAGGTRSVPTT